MIKIGINVSGSELKASLNPYILLETDCNKDRFAIYFENKLAKPSGIITGTPAL